MLAFGVTGYVVTQAPPAGYAQTGQSLAAADLSYSALAMLAPTPQPQSFTLAAHPATASSELPPPSTSSARMASDEDQRLAAARASATPAQETVQPSEPACDRSVSDLYCVYTVQPGDTLSKIAKSFGLQSTSGVASWELLVQSNKPDIVSADDFIQAGQKLRVPLQNGIVHLVLTGETLSELALDYGVAAATIVGPGNAAPTVLTIGQEVLIPNPTGIPQPRSASAAATPTPTPTPEATATVEATATSGADAQDLGTATPAATDTPTPRPSATGTPRPGSPIPTRTPTRGTPSPSRAGFIWPATGPISSYFGPSHPLGIDIDLYANPNAPVVAAGAGTVTFAGGNSCCSYGLYVILDHGNGYATLYAHLSSIAVVAGQKISQGQLLGLGGRTGYATGNHLHFEVRLNDAVIDPLSVLP